MGKINVARREGYDRSGRKYADRRYGPPIHDVYRRRRNEVLTEIISNAVGNNGPLKILEVGCGPGLTLEYLGGVSDKYELHGLDFSKTMLDVADERLQALPNRWKLVFGSAFQLPYTNEYFDVVYSTRFIHQFAHQEKMEIQREMLRVTRRGGVVANEFYARGHRIVRELLGAGKGKDYFYHSPTIKEVREIMGRDLKNYAVHMVGARIVSACFGENVLKKLTSTTVHPPLNLLLDYYFSAATKQAA